MKSQFMSSYKGGCITD